MKSHELKDAGKRAFPIPPLAMWSGFGVIDSDGVIDQVHVKDGALQWIKGSSHGSDFTCVLRDESIRRKILEIANEKYERGSNLHGNIIQVTYDDVVRRFGTPPRWPACATES
jgi:hypothetical protein